jgi:hypothetical protein
MAIETETLRPCWEKGSSLEIHMTEKSPVEIRITGRISPMDIGPRPTSKISDPAP